MDFWMDLEITLGDLVHVLEFMVELFDVLLKGF